MSASTTALAGQPMAEGFVRSAPRQIARVFLPGAKRSGPVGAQEAETPLAGSAWQFVVTATHWARAASAKPPLGKRHSVYTARVSRQIDKSFVLVHVRFRPPIYGYS